MKKSFQLPQGGLPLAEYYNKLNLIFKELDYQRRNDMTCVANMNKQRKCTTEDRVYIFLANLDHNLDKVSSCVLATSPLLSLEEAYSLVHHAMQRQVTMKIEDHFEASIMTIHKNTHNQHLLLILLTLLLASTHYNGTKHMVEVC